MLLQAQASCKEVMADDPDSEVVAAVEVEAGEAVEIGANAASRSAGSRRAAHAPPTGGPR